MEGEHCQLRKDQASIVFNGLNGAGKTTILHKLHLGEVVTTKLTADFNVEIVEYKNLQLVNWDVGGADTRTLCGHYYNGTVAIVFVVDSTDRERMDDNRKELHLIQKIESLKEAVVGVVANKQDIPGAMTSKEVGEKMNVEFIRKSHRCEVFGTSATTGEGLYEMLDWVAEAIATERTSK